MDKIVSHPIQEAAYLRSMVRGLFQLVKQDEQEKAVLRRLLSRSIHITYIIAIIAAIAVGDKIGFHDGIHEGIIRAKAQLYQLEANRRLEKPEHS